MVFYTAALVHAGLNLALYERRQFRWKAIEPLRRAGLSIPALIIAHIVGVRLGMLFEHQKPTRRCFMPT
jgi:adenylate cyclase